MRDLSEEEEVEIRAKESGLSYVNWMVTSVVWLMVPG